MQIVIITINDQGVNMSVHLAKGMRDILPSELRKRRRVIEMIQGVFEHSTGEKSSLLVLFKPHTDAEQNM